MRVRFAERAVQDLKDLSEYIKVDSPGAALRVRSAILDSIAMLSRFPEIGRAQEIVGVRKLVVRKYPYVIYYRIDPPNRIVVVLAIQHSAQKGT
jgi:addiction module RelE/StbE family toxin